MSPSDRAEIGESGANSILHYATLAFELLEPVPRIEQETLKANAKQQFGSLSFADIMEGKLMRATLCRRPHLLRTSTYFVDSREAIVEKYDALTEVESSLVVWSGDRPLQDALYVARF